MAVSFLNRTSVFWLNRPMVLWFGVDSPVISLYDPSIILVEIQLDGGTIRFATKDFYYPITAAYYKGDLLEPPEISKSLSGLYYGVEQTSPVTLSFSNRDITVDSTWDEIVAAEDIRGKWVLVTRYDPVDGPVYEFGGRITEYHIGETIDIEVEVREDEILDNLLPSDLVIAG